MSRISSSIKVNPADLMLKVADSLGDGVLAIDKQGCITFVNAALARILRLPTTEIVGTPVFDYVFDEDLSIAQRLFEQLAQGKEIRVEFRLRASDGAPVMTQCRTLQLLDDRGEFAGGVSVVQELRTPSEEVAARALANAIVDTTDDAIVTKTLDGIIRSWNKGAEKIFGYTANEAVGHSILMLLPKDRQQEESEILSILRSGKLIDHFETVRIRKDGTPIDVSVTISPLFDTSGTVIGASKIARDITDLKRKAEVSSHLAAIVESSEDAIISKSLKGIIQSWNNAAEKIFGYTASEAIGQPILLIVPPDRTYEEADILARIGRGERVDHFETVRRRKDGSYVDVSVTISPVRNSMGQVVGASKVARDITEQKRIQETMQRELDKLVKERMSGYEKANKELEGFTYSVSHDLRGPLRSIVSSCMILREDFGPQLPSEAQDELAKQAKAAKRMADLIDDLLKLSRLGRQELKKTTLDVTLIAQDLAADIQHAGTKCEIHIQQGMRAFGDQPTIKLLLGNLLENACKFSNQAGPVEVGEEQGVFFVRDQGIGFDQQYEEKLFLPFERLVLDRDYPGTGIGLANVKRIVERHGGKAWARSEGHGKGATFFFELPGE